MNVLSGIKTHDAIANITLSWLGIIVPQIDPIRVTAETISSLSDRILFEKLYHILANQDSDFDEWLKVSEHFEEESRNYEKMVRQLIYYNDRQIRT